MRSLAVALSLLLVTPPDLSDPFAPDPTADPAEPELEEPTADPPASGPSVEDLKVDARQLAAAGKLRESIEVYKSAYNLAPGDHCIAFEIATAAWKLRDCDVAKTYLDHFLRYADPVEYSNKRRLATDMRAEIARSDCERANTEVGEASAASVTHDPGAGDGLLIGGAVMVGLGVIALGSGVAMVAIGGGGGTTGPTCTMGKRCGNTCIELSDTCHVSATPNTTKSDPGLVGGGVALIAVGVGMTVGGGVMIVRGNRQPTRITLGPGSLSVQF